MDVPSEWTLGCQYRAPDRPSTGATSPAHADSAWAHGACGVRRPPSGRCCRRRWWSLFLVFAGPAVSLFAPSMRRMREDRARRDRSRDRRVLRLPRERRLRAHRRRDDRGDCGRRPRRGSRGSSSSFPASRLRAHALGSTWSGDPRLAGADRAALPERAGVDTVLSVTQRRSVTLAGPCPQPNGTFAPQRRSHGEMSPATEAELRSVAIPRRDSRARFRIGTALWLVVHRNVPMTALLVASCWGPWLLVRRGAVIAAPTANARGHILNAALVVPQRRRSDALGLVPAGRGARSRPALAALRRRSSSASWTSGSSASSVDPLVSVPRISGGGTRPAD